MVRSVEGAVLKWLAKDGATLESVSADLRISARTLRRRLAEIGIDPEKIKSIPTKPP